MKERERKREKERQLDRKKRRWKKRDREITLIHTGGQTGPRWRAPLGKSGPKIPVFGAFVPRLSYVFARAFFPLLRDNNW